MSTNPELARLRRAIVTDPFDKVCRHAFADALEEDGQLEEACKLRKQLAKPDPVFYMDWQFGEEVVYLSVYGFPTATELHYRVLGRYAGRIFSSYPLVSARLMWREPLQDLQLSNQASWLLRASPIGASQAALNAMVPDYLGTIAEESGLGRYVATVPSPQLLFDTKEEAVAAMSTWIITYGRDKAGLPPLPRS
jgi:uncharacterized protein (TIGR02996 family)